MKRNSQFWTKLGVYAILGLLLLNIIPTTLSLSSMTEQSLQPKRDRYDLIHISGGMGKNGWYISSVTITIHPPQGSGSVFYKINDGEWSVYQTPLSVGSDGFFIIYCFYFDEWGNQSPIYNASFKIDKTRPDSNITVQRHLRTVFVVVDAVDNMSGIDFVEFYCDDRLLGDVTGPPFEYLFEVSLFRGHTISVIVYDFAGNSDDESHTFPYDFRYGQGSFFQRIFRLLQHLILIYQLLTGIDEDRI